MFAPNPYTMLENSPWQTNLLDQQTMTVVYPHNMVKTETIIYQQ